MAKLADYITKNITVIKTLVKVGKMPLSVMQDYEMFRMWQKTASEKSQMQRYKIVAKSSKVSERTVIRAVSEMKKNI